MRAPHKKAHEVCPYGVTTTWADCDKARDDAYVDWQAMQQVILAYNIAVRGDGGTYRKDDTQFGQLVQLINGDREDFMNKDGNPSEAGFVIRLRAAIDRFKAGDLPVYCLYEPVTPAASEGG